MGVWWGESIARFVQLIFLNETGNYLVEIFMCRHIDDIYERIPHAWHAWTEEVFRMYPSLPMELYNRYNMRPKLGTITIRIYLPSKSTIIDGILQRLPDAIKIIWDVYRDAISAYEIYRYIDLILDKYIKLNNGTSKYVMLGIFNRTISNNTIKDLIHDFRRFALKADDIISLGFAIYANETILRALPLQRHILIGSYLSFLIGYNLNYKFITPLFNFLGFKFNIMDFIEVTPWNIHRVAEIVDENLILNGYIYFNRTSIEKLIRERIMIEYLNISRDYKAITLYLRNLGKITYPRNSKFRVEIYSWPGGGRGIQRIYIGEHLLANPLKPRDLVALNINVNLKYYRKQIIILIVTSPTGTIDGITFQLR